MVELKTSAGRLLIIAKNDAAVQVLKATKP